jgi:transketolase C-terminal domain/subunit
MRLIPEMQIFIPGNEKELESLFLENWGNGKPKYFRLSSKSHNQNIKIKTGDITLVRNSNNNKFVFVTGHLLDDVIEIPNVGILYVPTLSKINSQSVEEINKLLNPKSKLYTVENHSKNGGLGDLISQNFNLPVTRIGLDNKFITEYGSIDELREVSGISKTQIFEKINE